MWSQRGRGWHISSRHINSSGTYHIREAHMRCLQHTLQRRLPLLPFRAQLLNGVTSGVALSVLPAGVAVVYDRAVTTPILADRYLHHHTCSAALAQCCVQSFRTVDVRRRSSARHTAAACLRHTEHQLRWPNAWRQRRTQVHQRHGTQLSRPNRTGQQVGPV